MSADTAENRSYIQKQRLWLLGEVITMKLITEKPEDPLSAIVAVLNAEKTKQTEAIDPPPADVAADAKEYLQKHRVAFVIEDWLRTVLESKPEAPLDFSIDYFTKIHSATVEKEKQAAEAAKPTDDQSAAK